MLLHFGVASVQFVSVGCSYVYVVRCLIKWLLGCCQRIIFSVFQHRVISRSVIKLSLTYQPVHVQYIANILIILNITSYSY